MTNAMSDWDSYYDELAQNAPLTDTYPDTYTETAPVVAAVPPAALPKADTSGVQSVFARWFLPAVVVAALGAGVMFPEKFGLAEREVQTAQLFAAFPIDPLPAPESNITLRAYSDTQMRNFQLGLRRFSDADLLYYASVTQRDLDRAGPVLALLLEDALTLTHREIDRRNLTSLPVLRTIHDVQIQTPLRG